MSVIVKFAVSESTSEQFNTAVFRFMELKMTRADEEPIVRMANTPGQGWEHKELEFVSADLADEFHRFVSRLPLRVRADA